MVDGSSENLLDAKEEMHPFLREYSPLQMIFTNLNVSHFRQDFSQKEGLDEPRLSCAQTKNATALLSFLLPFFREEVSFTT